ncbi:MAG: galactose oxidase-like domain-containing protein, partial [Sediminicola sp.]
MRVNSVAGYFCGILFCFQVGIAQTPIQVDQNPNQSGIWSDPVPFGIVPVAVANLPDGRLLTWSAKFRNTFTEIGDGMTFTEIFDPFMGPDGTALGETTSNTDHDMFCPGINNLADGRILSAGGTSSERTSIYDPTTGVWSVAQDMNIPRGYQGNVTLSDGNVFTIGGSWSNGAGDNGGKDAEIWSPLTGWVLLPGIENEILWNNNDLSGEARGFYRIDNHVWLWPAPNGKLFHAGPGQTMHWIDVQGNNGQGSWSVVGPRGNDTYSMKGTTVMFDIGKILKVGGSRSYDSGTPAKDNSYVIDINNPSNVTVTATLNSLAESRTMHNSTVLPNGQVLVTGGLDHAAVFTDTGSRLTAELYDPQSNTWRSVAGMSVPRTYHSVAILMTDGRVFVGGGGLCDSTPDCDNHFDAEIYSPPYLFNSNGELAQRPNISAPSTADYETTINVTGSSGLSGFNLIRFSAATHSTNNEQRRIPVAFTENGGNYSLSIPNRNLLPPGYYMLFALDANGVPS